jgi:hypothetical protein
MPAKKIIILEQPAANTFRYVLWADVPNSHQVFYANAGRKSVWAGASDTDNQAIGSGVVAEREDILQVPPGETQAVTLARLQKIWTKYQASITNEATWAKYGSFWDGTSWTAAGIP